MTKKHYPQNPITLCTSLWQICR